MSQDASAARWGQLMAAGDRALGSAQPAEAAELFAAAAARAREAGAPEALATSLHRLCVVRDRQGLHEEATFFAEQALQLDEQTHGPVHPAVARDLHGLGTARLGTGDRAGAAQALERSAAISRRLQSPRELLLTLLALGRAQDDDAVVTLEEALTLAAQVPGGHPYRLRALHGLALAALAAGDAPGAHARWTELTRLGAGPERELRWRVELAEAWLGLGEVARRARGDAQDATWMFSLALRCLGPRPHPVGARALAALDAIGAAPRLLPDAAVAPQHFVVVVHEAGSPGDLAHPFGGRHTFPASTAPAGLAVGDWVRVVVEHGSLVGLERVDGP
jgi:tetratricopeptide (TPR) repeat protein